MKEPATRRPPQYRMVAYVVNKANRTLDVQALAEAMCTTWGRRWNGSRTPLRSLSRATGEAARRGLVVRPGHGLAGPRRRHRR